MFENLLDRGVSLPVRARAARYLRITAAVIGLVGMSVAVPGAQAQQNCPSDDPNQDYNCPAGPDYLMPGWGNVPWSQARYFQTIQTGDVDGDGQADLAGRDSHGLHLFMFDKATAAWRPVLTTDGKAELVLTDLSDRNGWSSPQYYQTIKLVKLDASPAVLVARFGTGLQVYEFVKSTPTSFGFPTGSWRTIASHGPFADGDGGGGGWNVAPYYQTLRYGMIDGSSNASVVGWGTQGLDTFTWTGSGWTRQALTPSFGDAAAADPQDIISLQLAKIDTTAKAKLLTVDTGGLSAHQFVPGTGWQVLVRDNQGYFANPACGMTESCAYTLQTAVLDSSGVPTVVARTSGCSRGGMAGVKLDSTTNQWTIAFDTGPFNDCPPGFDKSQNYRSIHAADIDGNGIDALIGRGSDGILAYRWNNASKTWSPMFANVPALSDTLWASDPSYWQTILTANVDGSKKAALLARGPTGIRTWLYNGSVFARPQPYGNFPVLDTASYAAINTFMHLPSSVRDTYINATEDTTSNQLSGYASQIAHNCPDEISGDPPQYQTCDPLAGTQNPAYTNTVNQLVKELWYASNVIDHYTTLQVMQAALFSVDGKTLPAIDANLKIPEASDESAAMNWLNLFDGILFFAGDAIDGAGADITFAADAVSLLLSGLPFFEHPQMTTSLEQRYADILSTVTSLQDAAQSNVLAHKHHVLGDYALLGSVGQLVGSRVWKLDEAGYLSVARYSFTYWVMQALLPAVWEQFQVTGCQNAPLVQCSPPANGPNMQSYGGGNFTGFLPKQTPCSEACSRVGCDTSCSWTNLSSEEASFVFAPITQQCTYSATAGTSWIYPANSTPGGCSLGVGSAIFTNSGGWKLQIDQISVGGSIGATISGVSAATNLHDPVLQPQLRLQMVGPLDAPVDLGTAQLQVGRLLREIGGAEELVKDAVGNDFIPVALLPQQVTPGRAVFETPLGQTPHITAIVQSKPGLAVNFDVRVDSASIVDPQLCVGTPPTTARLHALLQLSGGGLPQPANFVQVEDWECVTDAQGTLRMLRPAGNPAWRLTFVP